MFAFSRHCRYFSTWRSAIVEFQNSSRTIIGNTFSYFANPNIATLYFSALVFTLAERLGGRAIFLQFLNVALMNKVGAAVATVVAIGLWIAIPLRKESVIALVVFAVVAVIAVSVGAFDRAIATFESMSFWSISAPTPFPRCHSGSWSSLRERRIFPDSFG